MLTFDKIRDLERAEKQNKKLQKMPEDIASQIREYLKQKEKMSDKTSNDIREMENISSTIKRLVELRENKILSSVSDTIRTGMAPENMTKEEEAAFYKVTDVMKQNREKFFHDLHNEPKNETSYRVRQTVPAFIGPDMKTYELKEDEIIVIPKPLDELLLREGIIEKA